MAPLKNNAEILYRIESGSYQVTEESPNSLARIWSDAGCCLPWHCLFVSPPWLKAWIRCFGGISIPYLRAVWEAGELIGVAPLMIDRDRCIASFAGDSSVCDYLDFVIAPGKETEFFVWLLRDLRRKRINQLALQHVREDSLTLTVLKGVAENDGCRVSCQAADVAMAVALPDTWDEYLERLPGKQRHEIRRKLRRLYGAGRVSYFLTERPADTARAMDTFLKLFGRNSPHKAAFMTERMAGFFRALSREFAEVGMFKLFTLQIDGISAASVMCFDFQSMRYLYNNAYDRRFSHLSVGLMSKVLSLKDAIESKLKAYDFLKGSEVYKKRLGGKPLTLFNCKVDLNECPYL